MSKMKIGICGLIGCGKSYVSKLIADKRGYTHINTDRLFKEKVLTDGSYRCELSKFFEPLEVKPFIEFNYNSSEIAKLLFSDLQAEYRFPILRALNEFNAPYIKTAIMDALYLCNNAILEMATLPASRACPANLDAIIMVLGDGWSTADRNMRNHVERIYGRDNRDSTVTGNILKYQERELSKYVNNNNGVIGLRNMNVDDVDVDVMEEYESDDFVLAQFDEIVKSAKVLSNVGLHF